MAKVSAFCGNQEFPLYCASSGLVEFSALTKVLCSTGSSWSLLRARPHRLYPDSDKDSLLRTIWALIDTRAALSDFSGFLRINQHSTKQKSYVKKSISVIKYFVLIYNYFHVFWEVLMSFSYCFMVFWNALHFCRCS